MWLSLSTAVTRLDWVYFRWAGEHFLGRFPRTLPGGPTRLSCGLERVTRRHSAELLQSCLTLCDPRGWSPLAPLSMEFSRQEYWSVAISFSRGASPSWDRTRISCVSCIGRWVLYHWNTRETQETRVVCIQRALMDMISVLPTEPRGGHYTLCHCTAEKTSWFWEFKAPSHGHQLEEVVLGLNGAARFPSLTDLSCKVKLTFWIFDQ